MLPGHFDVHRWQKLLWLCDILVWLHMAGTLARARQMSFEWHYFKLANIWGECSSIKSNEYDFASYYRHLSAQTINWPTSIWYFISLVRSSRKKHQSWHRYIIISCQLTLMPLPTTMVSVLSRIIIYASLIILNFHAIGQYLIYLMALISVSPTASAKRMIYFC